MGEELDLNNALHPDQVRELRQQYKDKYGEDAFQPEGQSLTQAPRPPKAITSADVPRAPFIEPEAERTMHGPEVEKLRREFAENSGESS